MTPNSILIEILDGGYVLVLDYGLSRLKQVVKDKPYLLHRITQALDGEKLTAG